MKISAWGGLGGSSGSGNHLEKGSLCSCQFLAQNTHPYTPPEKGCKALLERLCQGM